MLNTNTEIASVKQEREARESLCPTERRMIVTMYNAHTLDRFMQSGYKAVRFLLILKANFRFHIASTDNDKVSAMTKYIKDPLGAIFQLFLKSLYDNRILRANTSGSKGIRGAEFLRELVAHPDPIGKIVLDPYFFDGFDTSNFAKIMHRVFGSDVGNSIQYNLKDFEADIDKFFSIMCGRVIEFAKDYDCYECEQLAKQGALDIFKHCIDCAHKCLGSGYLAYLQNVCGKVIIPEEHNLAISFNCCNCEAVYSSVGHEPLI